MDNNKLEELISRYGRLKSEMDSYKKQVDADNKDIKNIMSNMNINECSAGGYTAKYTVAISESFDEDKLVEKLLSLWDDEHPDEFRDSCPWVKRKYVPDMDEIENSLFNNELNGADLADCKIVKKIPKLTISKTKEKK